jgi:hypothetical protein
MFKIIAAKKSTNTISPFFHLSTHFEIKLSHKFDSRFRQVTLLFQCNSLLLAFESLFKYQDKFRYHMCFARVNGKPDNGTGMISLKILLITNLEEYQWYYVKES